MGTLLVLIILLIIVGAIVSSIVKEKKQGKPSCGCDCAHCPSACGHVAKQEK